MSIERGREQTLAKMSGRKGYNSPPPTPRSPASPAPRTHSASPRIGLSGGRKGYNASPARDGHLSPDSRAVSRGRQTSASEERRSPSKSGDERSGSRQGLGGGRKGYNDGTEGRKGYNDGTEGRKGYNDGSPAPSHSRSSSSSGVSAGEPGPNFAPRTHIGMGGRKGYNAGMHAVDAVVGLGISHSRDAPGGGRKGYSRGASPRT